MSWKRVESARTGVDYCQLSGVSLIDMVQSESSFIISGHCSTSIDSSAPWSEKEAYGTLYILCRLAANFLLLDRGNLQSLRCMI